MAVFLCERCHLPTGDIRSMASGAWFCPECIDATGEAPGAPVVAGGQGRSARAVEVSAWFLAALMVAAVALVVVLILGP